MPRQARQASGTGIYHVMMRGINHHVKDMIEDVDARLREFLEFEARSCSMDLTLSKSLTLGKA